MDSQWRRSKSLFSRFGRQDRAAVDPVRGRARRAQRGGLILDWFASRLRPRFPEAALDMVTERGPEIPGVRYHRGLNDADLAALYRRSWVLASPSRYEGFGLPYLEAMASGTPVVATPNPGSREVLGGGQFGVLANDRDFPREVELLLADAVRRESLIEARAETGSRILAHADSRSIRAVALADMQEIVDRANRAKIAPPMPFLALLNRGKSWGLLEVFALTIYLSSVLLFIPGAQAVRTAIRALPYVCSLAMLALAIAEGRKFSRGWTGRGLLLAATIILGLGIVHPESNTYSGLAQIVFQISIAAPAWFAATEPIGKKRLQRFLMLVFLANAASASVGLLQIYFPDRFMPPEFSRAALAANPDLVRSLSFTGANGELFVRPPGLTDLPGGACSGCANTILLGLLMGLQSGVSIPRRAIYMGLAGVGLVTLYLTQVRSMLLMSAVGYAAMCLLLIRQRRVFQSGLMASVGAGLFVGAFLLAVGIGGQSVLERFSGLFTKDAGETIYRSRGVFLEYTFTDLIFKYPFGAGLGRWGMMRMHFISLTPNPSPAIWVEIQATGWLIDGGIPLLATYSLAIAAVMWQLFRLTKPERGGPLAYPAAIVFCLNLFMIGQANAGPSFNSTGGMQFWLCTAVLFAAVSHRAELAHLFQSPRVAAE